MTLAVVTGAGIRVGRGIALALAREGYDLVLHANASIERAREVALEIEALGRVAIVEQADLANDDAVDALASRIALRGRPVDALVHSAGIFEQVPFADITRDQLRRMMKINVEAPFFLTQRLLPALRLARDPCVIHVVDIAADRPMNTYAHYSMSKAALAMLTRALAVELGPQVRVCGVAPGTVALPESFTPEQRAAALKRVPLGREGSPDDVARAVVFLVKSPYMNGAIVPVDGGRAVVL